MSVSFFQVGGGSAVNFRFVYSVGKVIIIEVPFPTLLCILSSPFINAYRDWEQIGRAHV